MLTWELVRGYLTGMRIPTARIFVHREVDWNRVAGDYSCELGYCLRMLSRRLLVIWPYNAQTRDVLQRTLLWVDRPLIRN